MKETIYEAITNQIVAAIEEGAATYRMPWHRLSADATFPANALTGRTYRGINVMMLWMAARAGQYRSGTWATYRQWQEKGCQVRKGEKSAPVVFWKDLKAGNEQADRDGDNEGGCRRFVARAYHVFNADQVDGFEPVEAAVLDDTKRDAEAERFFAAIPAKVGHGGDVAYFDPAGDMVQMVPFGQFKHAVGYYAVLAHELTHWTGAKSRLDRDLSGRFGSDSYAMEELVAEIGAAFLTGRLGLPSEPRTDHAPYIANWLKVLKSDSRAIFAAAGKAQAAADYLAGFANTSDPEVAPSS